MKKATQEEAAAITWVFWDIPRCPVPPGFDALLVGPCIRRFLKRLGYSGPLTIYAIGLLTDVSRQVLRDISSTGIVLVADPFGSGNFSSHVFWKISPAPANVMIISDPTNYSYCIDLSMLQVTLGYNIVKPYPYGPASPNAECAWKSFLLAESGALENKDKCIETDESASWVCSVCDKLRGQGFENFNTHLSSQKHAQEFLLWFSPDQLNSLCEPLEDSDLEEADPFEEAVEARVEHPHMVATPSERPHCYCGYIVMINQPKTWECSSPHPHMVATPSEPFLCHGSYIVMMNKPKTLAFPSLPHECHEKDEESLLDSQPKKFLEAGMAALEAGADENTIVTMRPSLTTRTSPSERTNKYIGNN